MSSDYDVLIAGAGMVGACLAALLGADPRTRKLKVGVLDARPPPGFDPRAPTGLRVSALSRASQNILSAAGAWQSIVSRRACAYQHMRVWDSRRDNRDDARADGVHFDSALLGEPNLGHIVENALVQTALHEVLKDAAGIDLLIPCRIDDVEAEEGGQVVTLDDGQARRCRLLIACDGAGSRVRTAAGIEVEESQYGQRAIVAVVTTELPHEDTAWQRFLPGGPLAFLPLASGESSIVWSCEQQRAEELLAQNDDEFATALTEAANSVLGSVTLSSTRAAFPLRRLRALEYARPALALAGDAAHVVHPLAGQGANLGLLDAAALAEVLGDACARGEAPGDLRVLRRYERWRKGENLAMLAVLDGLSKLFGSRVAPVGALRRAGMAIVAHSSPVANELARRALGLAGDLPQTASGLNEAGSSQGFA